MNPAKEGLVCFFYGVLVVGLFFFFLGRVARGGGAPWLLCFREFGGMLTEYGVLCVRLN